MQVGSKCVCAIMLNHDDVTFPQKTVIWFIGNNVGKHNQIRTHNRLTDHIMMSQQTFILIFNELEIEITIVS